MKAGGRLAVGDYAEDVPWRPSPFTGTARVERVAAEFERGATIVLQALHLHNLPVARFCRRLERELGHPVQANAYYTPRAAQGLAVHHDTHDVFCLQIAGEKRWLVYPPALELPLRDQRYRPELAAQGEPVLDVTLTSGDTLYLPRGWLHEALTSETDSLHLTVGVNVHTWLDAFRAALDECARENVGFRRSIPPDGAEPTGLVEALAARLSPGAVSGRMRERFVHTRRPVREDLFDQLRALEQLDLETQLVRRDTVIAELAVGDGGVALVYEGRKLRFPARVRAEIEFVVAAEEPFRLSDLPGPLDEEGRLVLARRLVREGFLRVSFD